MRYKRGTKIATRPSISAYQNSFVYSAVLAIFA
jgi:hypothetical protein